MWPRYVALGAVILLAFIADGAESQQASVSSQKSKSGPGPASAPDTILIGQPLDVALKILQLRNIRLFGDGFELARLDPDDAHLGFVLDEDNTWGCLHYSRSQRRVTSIWLVFFPSRGAHGKGDESWLRVRSLKLNEDRSYTAHFAPPLTDAERQRLRDRQPPPEIPPSRPPVAGRSGR